jgi:hypothetical protein
LAAHGCKTYLNLNLKVAPTDSVDDYMPDSTAAVAWQLYRYRAALECGLEYAYRM